MKISLNAPLYIFYDKLGADFGAKTPLESLVLWAKIRREDQPGAGWKRIAVDPENDYPNKTLSESNVFQLRVKEGNNPLSKLLKKKSLRKDGDVTDCHVVGGNTKLKDLFGSLAVILENAVDNDFFSVLLNFWVFLEFLLSAFLIIFWSGKGSIKNRKIIFKNYFLQIFQNKISDFSLKRTQKIPNLFAKSSTALRWRKTIWSILQNLVPSGLQCKRFNFSFVQSHFKQKGSRINRQD